MLSLALAAIVLGPFFTGGVAFAGDEKAAPAPGASFSAADVEFFEARVRPILVDQCMKCHGPKKQSSSLRLDSREALLKGGDSGPAIVPANPDQSLLIQAVSHTHEQLKMPPTGKLAEPTVATLRQWVSLGAPWPTGTTGATASAMTTPSASAKSATHWAFQPVRRQARPPVKDRGWARSPVDEFVLARLEAAGLTPSLWADKRTLIRRATIDLWGIPPTAEEVDAFESDNAADAFDRLVDRLLSSPRYGERWGRHWLDVARYADTKGYVFTEDRRYPYAYAYRDYVIAALNADLGYDQFIIQQIAADQLPTGKDTRALAAMGFMTVGRRFLLDQNEIIDDRIDVVCRGLLGLTVTCARCHDHKYDPIPTDDYYSLYGVFASSVEPAELPLLYRTDQASQHADYEKKMTAAKKARDDFLAARREELVADLQSRFSEYLKAAHDVDFDARTRKVEERALAMKLNSRRLRSVIGMWKRHLEGIQKTHDPVFGPWIAFAALPKDQFAAKATEAQRGLKSPSDPKAAAIHSLVAKSVLGSPPTDMADVVARYATLFSELESRWKQAAKTGAGKKSLPEPEWESLRLALFGPSGPLAVPINNPRLFINQAQKGGLDRLNGAIAKLDATHPAAPARAMVLNDAPKPTDPHVFVRGNPGRPGKAVPRRFLSLLAEPSRPPFQKGSGRLELAQAIADSKNPLTARVIVNRVWQWHFGKGLVTTPSDFGRRSDAPTHPELLDYLAAQFIDSGWSLKALHRMIMLSNTYQQRSEPRPEWLERDPENRLLWRFNRQRLDFESMRDSILAVAGTLDARIGGHAIPIAEPSFSTRRTVYGFIDRQNLDAVYRTFDFAVPDATSPRRFVTTVPQQALFLMNSPFLHEQARRLTASMGLDSSAKSVAAPAGCAVDPAEGVRRLYRRVFGRSPEPDELALATAFVCRETESRPGKLTEPGTDQRDKSTSALSPWAQLSQVLLLTNEFMFVD
jgi:hypothetical protein